MATIEISRAHSLGRKRARVAMEGLAEQLKKSIDARYRWEGDDLRLERTGATGNIHVTEEQVQVVIKLGFALSILKGKVTRHVHDYLNESLRE